VKLSLGHRHHEQVIYLDEDVYVVIGDHARPATMLSAWPATGTYGAEPPDGVIGALGELLGRIGPELWRAKRRGGEACLTGKLEDYGPAVVLRWGADCVEHLARRVRGVDGNVVETLALARRYAERREFESQAAGRLATEAQQALERLRNRGLASLGLGVVSRAVELCIDFWGLLGPSETRYEASEYSTAELRAMQVALMHASKELCRADPLLAGREAAMWCRRASARNALAHEGADRSSSAEQSSWFNLWVNPFASGTLARSLPGESKAILDGDGPETEWQAARLHEYLQCAHDDSLAPPTPW
jgi:hypothetical protein